MPDQAVESVQNDVYSHLGTGLHSIQDEGSHKGLLGAWNVTHTYVRDWFGYDVDDPNNDPSARDKSLDKSINYLGKFKSATCGG